MIITCNQCSTQFYLMRKELYPSGRKLKCSNCKTVWFQKYIAPPKVKFEKLDVQAIDLKNKKVFLPAVIKNRNPVWGWMSVTILFFIALGLGFMFFQDTVSEKHSGLSILYDKAGIPSINNVEVLSIEVSHKTNNQIELNGTIKNNSESYRRVPPFIIFLFDDKNNLLKSIFVPAAPKYFEKGGKHSFYKKIVGGFKTKPKKTVVTLASGVEVFLYKISA